MTDSLKKFQSLVHQLIIQPTPDGELAKALKRACEEELRGSKINLSVQERGGRQLGQVLGTSVPGAS